jgi:predicted peroxiredoxin
VTRRLLFLLIVLLQAAPSAATAAEQGREQVLLVHVTTLLDKDTDRTALVFRVAAAAAGKGRHVILLFDAEGVASLKLGRWFGGHSTPIDRAAIAPQDRKELAATLGTAPEGIPDIYGSLLHYLKGRGVAVYASRRALTLRGIGTDQFDRTAEPVSEEQMLELLDKAGMYLAY